MNERPIIFSAPMVQAILAGKKTQTRRVVKLDKNGRLVIERHRGYNVVADMDERGPVYRPSGGSPLEPLPLERIQKACPYGTIGDRLWVRETWSPYLGSLDDGSPRCVAYKADGTDRSPFWKSPMFMPRWASRITLEITGVRVERLQAITEADAYAEGVEIPAHLRFSSSGNPELRNEARTVYRQLWDSINGKKHPWESNPWVWVLDFETNKLNKGL